MISYSFIYNNIPEAPSRLINKSHQVSFYGQIILLKKKKKIGHIIIKVMCCKNFNAVLYGIGLEKKCR